MKKRKPLVKRVALSKTFRVLTNISTLMEELVLESTAP
jgi:hypothetical protein